MAHPDAAKFTIVVDGHPVALVPWVGRIPSEPSLFLPPQGIQGFECAATGDGVLAKETVPRGFLLGLALTKTSDFSTHAAEWVHPALRHARLALSKETANVEWVPPGVLGAYRQIPCGGEVLLRPDQFDGEPAPVTPRVPPTTTTTTTTPATATINQERNPRSRRCKRVRFSCASSLDIWQSVPVAALTAALRFPSEDSLSGTFAPPSLSESHVQARVWDPIRLRSSACDGEEDLDLASFSASGLFGWPLQIGACPRTKRWCLQAKSALPVGAVLGVVHLVSQSRHAAACPMCTVTIDDEPYSTVNAFHHVGVQVPDPALASTYHYHGRDRGNVCLMSSSLVLVVKPVAAGENLVWCHTPHGLSHSDTPSVMMCSRHASGWSMPATKLSHTPLAPLLCKDKSKFQGRRKSVPVFSLFSAQQACAGRRLTSTRRHAY